MRALIVLAVALCLSGCSQEGVVGSWDLVFASDDPAIAKRLDEVSGFEKTFKFNEDGTFWFTYGNQEAVGDYKGEGNKVTLSAEQKPTDDVLMLSEDGDTITGVIGKLDATLTRR